MGQRVVRGPARGTGFESGRVRRWRRDRFYELGFPLADAGKLAQSRVDLGDARYIIGKGCAPSVALRILL